MYVRVRARVFSNHSGPIISIICILVKKKKGGGWRGRLTFAAELAAGETTNAAGRT